MSVTDRAADVTDQVLDAVKTGQQSALEAVHTFVEKVNDAIPGESEEKPGQREKVIDSAFQMADRLVAALFEFVQKLVGATAKSLGAHKDEDVTK
jgi:oligoribonuclease (3'-5' exoribonuclease)